MWMNVAETAHSTQAVDVDVDDIIQTLPARRPSTSVERRPETTCCFVCEQLVPPDQARLMWVWNMLQNVCTECEQQFAVPQYTGAREMVIRMDVESFRNKVRAMGRRA